MLGEAAGDWRRDVLDVAVLWTVRLGSILAVALLLSVVVHQPGRLLEPAVLCMYGSYAGMIALRFRSELPYRGRAITFCALLLVMGIASLYGLGALPGPTLVFTFVVVTAQLFLGSRAMLVALGLTSAAMVLTGLARPTIVRWPDAERLGTWFWVREGLGFAVPTAALAVILARVISTIEHSLRAAQESLVRSRLAESERERAKAALVQAELALDRSQKLQAVGKLAAGVGHDFNNTLQVMLSWSSMLREERDEAVLEEGLDAIEQAALQGRELTQRLLEFGRRDVRAPARCSLAQLVRESARSLRRLLPEDIAIELELDERAPSVLVDPNQLAHVLLNLGVNARDAMPAGGVLRLGVSSVDASELGEAAAPIAGPLVGETRSPRRVSPNVEEGPSADCPIGSGSTCPSPAQRGRGEPGTNLGHEILVRVSVQDTGIGMSAETLSHLFEPFYTTKGDRGTGLGLATAHSMVERNGGFIRVSSREGQGSTFQLCFPAQPAAATAVEEREPAPLQAGTGVVMVAEDDAEVRRTIVRVLASAGYRVLQSADATSAMALLEQRGAEVDLLCTDGIMPGGGTRQLIDHYLRCRPDGRVIVCSGYVQEELLRRDLDAGVHAYLPKPFHASELIERIGRMLQSH
jgi:signal transduction histidine kinase/CheY-like chemotaxis protein